MSEKEETALTVKSDDVFTIGKVFAESGFFPDTREAAKAVVKVLAGREIGLGPIASMTGIHIIRGKPSLSAGVMAGVIKANEHYNYKIIKLDDEVCELAFYEDGTELQPRSIFTIKDAKQAELTTGKNAHSWKHYPRNMLFARALSNGARWHCPHLFNGTAYTPEEFDVPVDKDGNIISGSYSIVDEKAVIDEKRQEVLAFHTEHPELDDSELAEACSVPTIKVKRWLAEAEQDEEIIEGEAEETPDGNE